MVTTTVTNDVYMTADLCSCTDSVAPPSFTALPAPFSAVSRVLQQSPGFLAVVLRAGVFVVACRSQASSLTLLIAQMQENADQVEKDILRSEELLAVVRRLGLLRLRLCLCQSHHQCPLVPPGQ